MEPKEPTTDSVAEPIVVPDWVAKGLPPKLSELRRKLYLKAKQESSFRFYALYDRIYRMDVLQAAWEQVRRNDGAAGPDGVTIDQIVSQEGGPQRLIDELYEELRTKSYSPGHVRRVYVPKPDGRQRPLGIPNVRDRIVQTAVVLILTPIFEADFLDCSFGFRPQRRAHDALKLVRQELNNERTMIYDADIEGYFDSIPHDKLMAAVQQRVVDRNVLLLLRGWLQAPVEDGQDGSPPKRRSQGTPQGGVVSPLLGNIYLNWFDRAFHSKDGPAKFVGARLVRYADDMVILTRYPSERMERWVERVMGQRLKLVLHPEKTRRVNLRTEGSSLDFLGYTFRYDRDLQGRDHDYLNVTPSNKSLSRAREKLRELTSARMVYKSVRTVIGEVNEYVSGWADYFGWGYPRVAMRKMNRMVRVRLHAHLKRRSQRRYRPPEGKSEYQHLADLGLVYL